MTRMGNFFFLNSANIFRKLLFQTEHIHNISHTNIEALYYCIHVKHIDTPITFSHMSNSTHSIDIKCYEEFFYDIKKLKFVW